MTFLRRTIDAAKSMVPDMPSAEDLTLVDVTHGKDLSTMVGTLAKAGVEKDHVLRVQRSSKKAMLKRTTSISKARQDMQETFQRTLKSETHSPDASRSPDTTP